MTSNRDQLDPLCERDGGILVRLAGMILAGLLLMLPGPVAAAGVPALQRQAQPPKLTHPMRVIVVSDARPGCEPNCAEWISAEGEIGPETRAEFRRVLNALGQRKLPIFISSKGGSVGQALAIGRDIRRRGLDVAVERTIFRKCEPNPAACDPRTLNDGDKGRPEPIGAYCASACVFILAAGIQRAVPIYGRVGVHQFIEFRTYKRVSRTYRVVRRVVNGRPVEVSRELISETPLPSTTIETDPDYAPARSYLSEMGIDAAAILPLMTATAHSDVHWMTPDERRTTHLVTLVSSGTSLLPPIPEPPAKPPSTQPGAQGVVVPPNVLADVTLFYPPGGKTLDLFVRLRAPGAPLRMDRYAADVTLADGKHLFAASTGRDAADPLYATMAQDEFCSLKRSAGLALRLTVSDSANAATTQHLALDLSKNPGIASFAEAHCR